MALGVVLWVTVTPPLKVLDSGSERAGQPVLGSRRRRPSPRPSVSVTGQASRVLTVRERRVRALPEPLTAESQAPSRQTAHGPARAWGALRPPPRPCPWGPGGGAAPDGNHVPRSAIRISRKGRHALLNLCLHAALTFTAFAGGINRTKYRTLCQAVSAAHGITLYTSEGPSALLPKGKRVVTAMKSHSRVCSAVSRGRWLKGQHVCCRPR